jgi:hypothetical protein
MEISQCNSIVYANKNEKKKMDLFPFSDLKKILLLLQPLASSFGVTISILTWNYRNDSVILWAKCQHSRLLLNEIDSVVSHFSYITADFFR